jgi:hypothetical protein
MIKDALVPIALRVLPIAMIPHISCKFRTILDLSFSLRLYYGIEITSVNDATNKDNSLTNAMGQLGKVLPRLIANMAKASIKGGPLLFATKPDIKDGYWQMVVAKYEEWCFACVLPIRVDDTDHHIVIPNSLQIMDWAESPLFFCAASKIARADIAYTLAVVPVATAKPHPLEHFMLPPDKWPETYVEDHGWKFMCIFEDYFDNFITMAQRTEHNEL